MYSRSKGAEPSFYVQMTIAKTQGGSLDRYNRACAAYVPGFDSDEPLDMAFDDAAPERKRRKDRDMTPLEFRDARGELGHKWGLGRPLTLTEFGRVLRLGGQRPDQSVRDYERGKTQVSGPLSLLVEMLLSGAKPKGLDKIISPGN